MLAVDNIRSHPQLMAILRNQARAFLDVERAEPKAASIFGTQQRFMLAQLGASMVFRSRNQGILLTHFMAAAAQHKISSRNTANSFLQEMLQYGLASHGNGISDKRTKPVHMSDYARKMIEVWLSIHLNAIDSVDGKSRAAILTERPEALEFIHPVISDTVLNSQHFRPSKGTISLFTWMTDGGLIMDRMFSSISDPEDETGRMLTTLQSFDEIAQPLRITKAHLSRRMRIAEDNGCIGWTGKRGSSTFWISSGFVDEYINYQVGKLSLISEAFRRATSRLWLRPDNIGTCATG